MSVNLPDPMTYCKARMLDANLYGRHLESEMFSRIIAVLARHNALCNAVAWERECEECREPLHGAWWARNEFDLSEIEALYGCARAEVDRLINERAADCKEEE